MNNKLCYMDAELSTVAQLTLKYLDKHNVAWASAEQIARGTGFEPHQVNEVMRERSSSHLLSAGNNGLVEIHHTESLPGGANDRRLYEITEEGSWVVDQYNEEMADMPEITDLEQAVLELQDAVFNSHEERLSFLFEEWRPAIEEAAKENRDELVEVQESVVVLEAEVGNLKGIVACLDLDEGGGN